LFVQSLRLEQFLQSVLLVLSLQFVQLVPSVHLDRWCSWNSRVIRYS
jgi:hypothetical protein